MADSTRHVERAVVEGRHRLVLFWLAGGQHVNPRDLTPSRRLAFGGDQPTNVGKAIDSAFRRGAQGAAIALFPLLVLAVSSALGDARDAPGWITWVWCSALCAINLVFLIGGPVLWNALITAGIAIDQLAMSREDNHAVAAWVRGHYASRVVQGILMLLGAGVGMGLLVFIDGASESAFTLGPGEFVTMAWTAGLAVNGLWILWWIAGLIPVLGRRESLRLDWHNPARTPAVVFLNRALWKAGGAISLGMVLLAVAVQGQPSPFTFAGGIPPAWVAAVIVEYLAFVIVACVFVRGGFWAQWKVFRLVRVHIDRGRAPVDAQLISLTDEYPKHNRRSAKVQYYAELDRHFDSLRTVDLKLGWALAWATSIFGAAASVLSSAISITPN
ncbi:MAG: hypothetical protein EPO52_04215 [Herbiconiux sp.]|uniref:hypothetical protein n=1 Tax=Herbiconiux sp. TaxID=1871186 RepID=UPI001201B680|nr:hypothetical protein [Herbiconiux sp.]TAJ49481.1 MAG: hypothetical protein EPO52_04215 [Herbiconiux sp.]